MRLWSTPDSRTTTETRERAATRDLRAWPPSVGAPTLLSLMAARSKLLPGADEREFGIQVILNNLRRGDYCLHL